VTETLEFVYTVASKVETLQLDGESQYLFHGGLVLAEGQGEPMNMAFRVPLDIWNATLPGDALVFSHTRTIPVAELLETE